MLKKFFQLYNITRKTGIPYNSTGQALAECRHLTLKHYLSKQKSGLLPDMLKLTTNQQLMHALHVLNFDLLKGDGRSTMKVHFSDNISFFETTAVLVWTSPKVPILGVLLHIVF